MMLDLSQFEGHTPGPWEAWEHNDPEKMIPIGHLDNFVPLAHVGTRNRPNNINARLMAAAPDLLAEDTNLRRLLLAWYENECGMGGEFGWDELLDRTREALGRAD